jgi:chromosome segregation ATPase
MNTPTTPDMQEAAHLEKLRTQISTDIEAMQQKEASLKEYEQRLRLLVEHAQQNPAAQNTSHNYVTTGPNSQASLDAEWEKYERAHALLEAARRGLSEDRMALKEREQKVLLRETEVARREGWVKALEQELAVIAQAQAAVAAAKAKPTFVSAPLLAAKNLFTTAKSA